MTQQARIGLIVFAAIGGVFVLIVLGVAVLIASKSDPSKTTKPAKGTNTTSSSAKGASKGKGPESFPGIGAVNSLEEDGIDPLKDRYSIGDQITVIATVESVVPTSGDLELETSKLQFEKDPEQIKAIQERINSMITGYGVLLNSRVPFKLAKGGRSVSMLFHMTKITGAEYESLSSRLKNKRVKASGILRSQGQVWDLRDCRIEVLN